MRRRRASSVTRYSPMPSRVTAVTLSPELSPTCINQICNSENRRPVFCLLVLGEVLGVSFDELSDDCGIDAVDQHQAPFGRLRFVRIQQDAPRWPAPNAPPPEL